MGEENIFFYKFVCLKPCGCVTTLYGSNWSLFTVQSGPLTLDKMQQRNRLSQLELEKVLHLFSNCVEDGTGARKDGRM